MAKFEMLKALRITEDKTVECRLVDVPGCPVLVLGPAIPAVNHAYRDEAMRQARRRSEKHAVTAKSSAADVHALVDAHRRDDAVLFAAHVARGWSGVLDDDGKPVPFAPDTCAEFLTALCEQAPDVFDLVRDRAKDEGSFRDVGGAAALPKP